MGPRIVAFVGLTIYRDFFQHKQTGGAGAKPEHIHGARLFVLPNPSGLNQSYPGFADKRVWFERLREFAADADPHPSGSSSSQPDSGSY